MRLNEEVDKQRLHRIAVYGELVVAVFGIRRCVLQPVERRLSRQHRTIGAPRFELARKQTQHRIMAQLVMVVQVLIAERNAMHALRNQRFQAVLYLILIAAIAETGRGTTRQADAPVDLPHQQSAGVRGQHAAIERSCDFATPKGFKLELPRVTVCRHRLALQNQLKCLLQNNFR